MNNYPLVSIAILSYNTGNYVIESLNNVVEQNYPNIEIFIIDDCSTDNISVNLIKNWIKENTHLNLTIHANYRSQNKGAHFGLNEIIQKAKGKYICMNGDDLWTADKISYQVEKLEKLGDEYAMYYGDIENIDAASKIIEHAEYKHGFAKNFVIPTGDIFKESITNFCFWIQSTTIRLDLLKKINFKFDDKFISEDWHLIISISRYYKIMGENKIFAYYRWLDSSVTRRLWTNENYHNIIFSQFEMILSFINHPKNSAEDNITIVNKLISLLLEIKPKNLKVRNQILRKYLKLLIKANFNRNVIKEGKKIKKIILN